MFSKLKNPECPARPDFNNAGDYLRRFGSYLEYMKGSQNPEPIYIRGDEELKLALATLFESAQLSVHIMGNFKTNHVFSDSSVLKAAKAFLQRSGTTMKVLLEADDRETKAFVEALQKQFSDKIEVIKVSHQIGQKYDIRFVNADTLSYIYAPDQNAAMVARYVGKKFYKTAEAFKEENTLPVSLIGFFLKVCQQIDTQNPSQKPA